jgi:hypothetical protein
MVFINLSVFSQYAKVPDKGLVAEDISVKYGQYIVFLEIVTILAGVLVSILTFTLLKLVAHHTT